MLHLLLLLFTISHCISCTAYTTEFVALLEQQKVCFANFVFTDILGNMKEVTVPLSHVADALEHGLAFDGSSIAGCAQIAESDMILKPDLKTARIIPWFTGPNKTVMIICDVYKDLQAPHEGDPRRILQRVLQEADQLGYTFFVGPELEFFFVQKGKTDPIDEHAYWDIEKNAQAFIHKSSLVMALTSFGVNVEKLHHEVASGQHEISIHYGDALAIADQVMLAKFTLQSLAQEYGYHTSFMPKPFVNQNGSAMHIHFSLWENDEQQNAFAGENMQISPIGRHFIAGVLHHINNLAAIYNPTINSYKRLVPGYEAPTYVCWGTKNRSALVRVPLVFNEKAIRAELRCPDPLCNPYLAFAALLKSGLDGIKQQLALAPAVEENLYKLSKEECLARAIHTLPGSLEQAVENLKTNTLALELFSKKTMDQYLLLKNKEIRSYNTHISAWELEHYL